MWNKKGRQPGRGAGVGDSADAASERGYEEGERLKAMQLGVNKTTAASQQICHGEVGDAVLKRYPRWTETEKRHERFNH